MKDIVKEYGYYQDDNIPEEIKNNERFKKHYLLYKKDFDSYPVPKELESLDYEYGVYYYIKEEDNASLYIYGIDLLIYSRKHKLLLKIEKDNIYKKYRLMFVKQRDIGRRDIVPTVKKKWIKDAGLIEPNFINILSNKNINQWFDYYINYIKTIDNNIIEYDLKVEENIKYVDDICERFKEYNIFRGKNHCEIDTPLFKVEFMFRLNKYYLTNNITFKGGVDDVMDILGIQKL